jgi:hypothetical protein
MDEIKAGEGLNTEHDWTDIDSEESDRETEIVGRLLLSAFDLSDADVDRIWENLPPVEWRFDPEQLAERVVKQAKTN